MADGFFSKSAGQDRRKWLEAKADGLTQFVPPEMRKWFEIADMMNPVSEIGRAGQDAERMMDPNLGGWERAAAGGDMLSSMAGVVAPVAVAKAAGMPAAQALQEAMMNASAGQRAGVDAFLADEFGGVNLNSLPFFHGTPDGREVRAAGKFSADKPVFLSDSRAVASTYADDTRAFDYQNAVPEVFTAKTSPEKVLDINAGGADFRGIDAETVRQALSRAGVSDGDSADAFLQVRVRDDGKIRTDDLVKIVKKLGFDAADVANVRDTYNNAAKSRPSTVRMMMNPGQIAVDGLSPPTKAQQIADMLANGRAGDVTDDLMAQADPSEMWKLYQSGATGADMPMDAASRMARAEGMGFDTGTPLYRGDRDLQAYGRGAPGPREGIGVSVSDSPEVAATYVPEGGGMSSLLGRSSKPVEIDGQGNSWRMIEPDTNITTPTNGKTRRLDEVLDPEQYMSDEALQDYQAGLPYARYTTDELSRAMQGKGADRVTFDSIKDFGGFGRYMTDRAKEPSRVSMLADPSQLRSKFARFDPRLKHLANLSAGGAGVAYMGGQDDNKAQIRAWLEGQK
jgi:hypothetical protein